MRNLKLQRHAMFTLWAILTATSVLLAVLAVGDPEKSNLDFALLIGASFMGVFMMERVRKS